MRLAIAASQADQEQIKLKEAEEDALLQQAIEMSKKEEEARIEKIKRIEAEQLQNSLKLS